MLPPMPLAEVQGNLAMLAGVAADHAGRPTLAALAALTTAGACAGAAAQMLLAHNRFTRGARICCAAGLLMLAAVAALTFAPGAPASLAAAVHLCAALALTAAVVFLLRHERRRGEEITALRTVVDRRDSDVRAQAERLRRLDVLDPATDLLNRRAFLRAAQDAIEGCVQQNQPLALLLVELANGAASPRRAEAARALRAVAEALRGAVRGSDLAARWERGQLALLMPQCRDPRPAAARLRSLLHRCSGAAEQIRVAGVTVNAGGPWPEAEGLMAAAQATLAAARRAPGLTDDTIWPIDWGLAAPAAANQS